MKNETAMREIEFLDYYLQNHTDDYSEESHTAMMMAIKALEQQPCEDCISREEAKRLLAIRRDELMMLNSKDNPKADATAHGVNWSLNTLMELPPVTPQPKIGRWLEKEVITDKVIEEWQSARCSVCDKYHTTPYMYYFDNYKFCPICGAKMEAEE